MDIKKFVQDIFANLIANILVVAGGTLVIILVFFQRLPAYQLLLLIIGTIGLILFVINQYALWKERRKKRLTKLSDKELEQLIREWVDIPAFKFQRQEAVPGVYFAFEVTLGDLTVHLERQEKEPLVVILAGEVLLQTPPDKTMSEADWERLAGQLSIEMARLGIQFYFNGAPNKWERIRLIESVILDDSLTGFYFRPRVMFVIRALILVLEVAKEFFREIQPNKPVSDKEGS